MNSPVDVLCVGQAPYDLSFTIPHYPQPDEKIVATAFAGSGGGPAANAAVAVTRLGGRSALAAYLGMDEFGDRHLRELQATAVDTRFIVRGPEPTSLSLVLVQPDGRRALVNYRGDTPPLPPSGADFLAVHPRVILFDGLEPLISLPLARQAHKKGIPSVLDAGSLHDGTKTLLEMVDYAVVSAKFSYQYTGKRQPAEALSLLAKLAPHVVITLGDRGLIWQTPTAAGALAAIPVTAVDSTGAGDAWHGAFAYGLSQRMEWLELLRYASAVAALTCTRHGARPALPSAQQVAVLLARHP